ncbi:Protein DEFECTIVE IN MERISTEM SILENCING 3 [Cucurbita argyrosperma subsp. argyrosperma]|nr:Protein DEFECTIVE IN MERISTEM SILENCING 3 [Cucurbita argyrosperma subsp. argyrosperma]
MSEEVGVFANLKCGFSVPFSFGVGFETRFRIRRWRHKPHSASVLMKLDEIDKCRVPKDEMQEGGLSHEDPTNLRSKKLQDDLQTLGTKLQLHEDNIRFLRTLKDKLVDSIIDLQVTLGKYHASSTPKIETQDGADTQTEDKLSDQKQILQEENSAASILCQLKTNPKMLASDPTLSDDVLGVVAELGKVDDSVLSSLLSEYLGTETMLAIVCKTYNGVKSLEKYDKEGCINKTSGLHGFGTSLGKTLEGRFNVISLETLRPYAGDFVANDPQKRLDIPNPRLPNGYCPAGFIGYAVNMINIDRTYLFFLTASGYGLRETLFYSLFSCLQIYKTRTEMLQAVPCITDGALSLDGGIIKRSGLFCLGNRDDVKVRFSKTSTNSSLPDHYTESERQMKEMKWKKEKILEDMRREQALLDSTRLNFERKRVEFVQFLAETAARRHFRARMAGKAVKSVAKAIGEYQYPWQEKLVKYKNELSKGVWGYWELGAWKPLGISARRRARLRKEVLLAGQDWAYDPERKEMRTKRKGHKCDRIAAEKRENTARLMEKMPDMLLQYKKRRWEKKMKEEEKKKQQ